MGNLVVITKTLATAAATNVALSQSPGATAALTLNGAAVTGGVATIDTFNATTNTAPGRRVILTSGGNDTGIVWTVNGANSTGSAQTDSFAGANAGAAQSNLDFTTVTSITHTGSVATTVTAGTNGVGSTPWRNLNWRSGPPLNLGVLMEIISGTVTYSVQYTYDDPTNLGPNVSYPVAINDPVIVSQDSALIESARTTPAQAVRFVILSGTGVLRARFLQTTPG